MAGYACVFHDGEAEAVHIHQTLGQPGVISVCDECQPVYLITTLAAALGLDGGNLYDVVRSYQASVQQQGEPPAAPDAADEPPMPAGPHPAIVVDGETVTRWDWCACDAPGPHLSDGEQAPPATLGLLTAEVCPFCQGEVRGAVTDQPSALTAHMNSCEHAPQAAEPAGQS